NMNFLVLLSRGKRRLDGGSGRSHGLNTYRFFVIERSSSDIGSQVVHSLRISVGVFRMIMRRREKRRPVEVFATSNVRLHAPQNVAEHAQSRNRIGAIVEFEP